MAIYLVEEDKIYYYSLPIQDNSGKAGTPDTIIEGNVIIHFVWNIYLGFREILKLDTLNSCFNAQEQLKLLGRRGMYKLHHYLPYYKSVLGY